MVFTGGNSDEQLRRTTQIKNSGANDFQFTFRRSMPSKDQRHMFSGAICAPNQKPAFKESTCFIM